MLNSLFLYGPKETVQTKVTKRTSTLGFPQLYVAVSSADTHLHSFAHSQIQEENIMQEKLQFFNTFPFLEIVLDKFYICISQLRRQRGTPVKGASTDQIAHCWHNWGQNCRLPALYQLPRNQAH